jgi:hypothetical protein
VPAHLQPSSIRLPTVVGTLLGLLAAQQEDRPEPPAPKAQPTVVDLGTVAVGATVEASFGVFWTDPALAKANATVEPAAGTVLLQVKTSEYSDRALTEVEFALTTDRPGDVDQVFTVRCGTEVAKVPLRAQVMAIPAGGSRVLIAETPFETFSADDPATFAAWRQAVASGRLEVDYRLARSGRVTFDVEALRRVDVVLVAESALLRLDDAQVARLHGFVCGGGRLVVFANAFFVKSTVHANRLCEPFGIRIRDRELPGADTFKTDADGIAKSPLTVGIDELSVHRPSPVEILDEQAAAALITLATPRTQTLVARASTKSGGEVIAVGDSLWWNSANKSAGYARLLRNLLTRAPRPH